MRGNNTDKTTDRRRKTELCTEITRERKGEWRRRKGGKEEGRERGWMWKDRGMRRREKE